MEADFARRIPLAKLSWWDSGDDEDDNENDDGDDDDDDDGDADLAGRSPLARLPRWPGREEGQEEGRELRRRPN